MKLPAALCILHRPVQQLLVTLDRQQVVLTLLDDGAGDVSLTAHGINGDQAPLDIQQLELCQNGRDFIGLGIGFQLVHDHAVVGGEGADHMNGGAALSRWQEPRNILLSMAINSPPVRSLTNCAHGIKHC